MWGGEKPRTTNVHAEYAERQEYCTALEENMDGLYMLAFLLTANHKEAEECFLLTVESVFNERGVFKEWTLAWVKRCLIKHAIQIVFSRSAGNVKRDLWSVRRHDVEQYRAIDAVTALPALERFVFVMSVIESHSNWDCSILLGCNTSIVAETRMRALCSLPQQAEIMSGAGSPIAGLLEVTA